MKSNYHERKEAQIERMRDRAERKRKESEAQIEQARKMASVIPFGQPILVGHHSEGRDRRYRQRIHNKFDGGFKGLDEASHLEQRAENAENNKAISSDNPDALDLLHEKLEKLQEWQTLMVAANKQFRKGDKPETRAELTKLGFTDKQIDEFFIPDFCGRIGFASYQLSNNNGKIKSVRDRIAFLEQQSTDQSQEWKFNDGKCTLEDNVDDNRVKLYFPGKPADDIRTALKSHGFHWSKYEGAWMRMRSAMALWQAQQIITEFYGDKFDEK